MSNNNNMMGCGLVQYIPLSTTSHISILAVSLVPTVCKQMSENQKENGEGWKRSSKEREKEREKRDKAREMHIKALFSTLYYHGHTWVAPVNASNLNFIGRNVTLYERLPLHSVIQASFPSIPVSTQHNLHYRGIGRQ